MSLKSTRKEIVARQLMKIANSLVEAGDEENFNEEYETSRKFDPDTCLEFSNRQNLGNGITIYDVDDSFEGMMSVIAAMDPSWGYNKRYWFADTQDQNNINRVWKNWKRHNAYQKRVAFKNGKLFMFSAGRIDELIWWDSDGAQYNHLPGAFDKQGYELAGDDLGMAKDPNVTVASLIKLTESRDKVVRYEIANNPKTPAEVLRILANDESGWVRRRVAFNSKTPAEVLKILANDEYNDVKRGVAQNSNTPVETLKMLADDEYELASQEAIKNLRNRS